MFNEARLEILLEAYFDQELTPAERKELEQMLLASARARELFWERARHHSAIREWGMAEWGRKLAAEIPEPALAPAPAAAASSAHSAPAGPASESTPGLLSYWRTALGWGLAVTACVALLLFLWRPASRQDSRPAASFNDETPDKGIAVLTRAAGVKWTDGTKTLAPGVALEPGWLKLSEGVVNLEFYSGARLIVEGPAELRLDSPMEAFCKFGKLNVYVPDQAHGFKLRSPEMDVVDLGTAFGLNIPAGGPSEVHVFGGEVELTRVGNQTLTRKLSEGQGLRVDRTGETSPIRSAPGDFVTLPELAKRESVEFTGRFNAWKASNEIIERDPATLVHYTFEGEPNGDRRIRNAARNASPLTEASIVGCAWTQGRWPDKPALEFKGRSDRVRLGIPGRHEQLTYIAWVRVDSLPRINNALLCDNDLGVGEVRWDITRKGELRFSVRVVSNAFERAISPPIITPDRFGQWIHLATVYEAGTRMVRHYVDGKPVAVTHLARTVPAKLSNLELGNWGVRADNPLLLRNDEDYITRAFNGRFDEFILSARLFTEEEIRQRYETGKPMAVLASLRR